ncbi:acyltransferase [Sphingobium sp. AR-3-1]|uniref:Acyltransferase n=1 Tax=Sphingobium psychrophilum TaxID=2728834 RepID=A0A7X9ZW55_9SPHN|nr:acyltransferase [Sphingobium psychrophilum]NML13059.1 acyltransferase [Sphingobium psychrophilum]
MEKPHTLVSLQGLRFFAAFLVLVGHVQAESIRTFGNAGDPLSYPWAVGVDIFFAISGFVMAITAADKAGSLGNAKVFLYRRLVRIVPIYWIFTTLAVVMLFAAHKGISVSEVVSSYAFILWSDGPIDNRATPVLSIGWTINHEMMFYLFFGLTMLLPRKYSLTALVVALSLMMISHGFITKEHSTLYTWTNPIIGEFLVGVGLGQIYKRGVRIRPIFAVIVTFVCLIFLGLLPEVYDWRPLAWGAPASIIVAMIVLSSDISIDHPLNRMMKLGGDASYSIYLSHIFTLNAVSTIWGKMRLPEVAGLYVACAIAASVIAGVIVHLIIEKKIADILRPRTGGDRKALATPEPAHS